MQNFEFQIDPENLTRARMLQHTYRPYAPLLKGLPEYDWNAMPRYDLQHRILCGYVQLEEDPRAILTFAVGSETGDSPLPVESISQVQILIGIRNDLLDVRRTAERILSCILQHAANPATTALFGIAKSGVRPSKSGYKFGVNGPGLSGQPGNDVENGKGYWMMRAPRGRTRT